MIPVVGLHMAFAYIAPYPLNKMNIVFASVIIYLLFNKSGAVVWISFMLHYLVELYSVTTFGIILFSGTVSILIVYWLSKNIFTNPRLIVAVGLCAMGLLLYRVISACLVLLLYLFSRGSYDTGLVPGAVALYMWELLFTTMFVSALYAIISVFRKNKPGVLV